MCKYTSNEIESAIDWDDLDYADDGYKTTVTLRCEPVEIEKVDGKPPAEGGGENIFAVIKVGDQFFKKTGYYASHYGSEWDGDLTEVRPVEKTVTVYERI